MSSPVAVRGPGSHSTSASSSRPPSASRSRCRLARRGAGRRPASTRSASPAAGPLIRITPIAAGGAPLDSAKMVSSISSSARIERLFFGAAAGREELLEQLDAHLAHRRELLGVFLQLLEAAYALHRLERGIDIGLVGLAHVWQAQEPARFFGRAIDLDIDFHGSHLGCAGCRLGDTRPWQSPSGKPRIGLTKAPK